VGYVGKVWGGRAVCTVWLPFVEAVHATQADVPWRQVVRRQWLQKRMGKTRAKWLAGRNGSKDA